MKRLGVLVGLLLIASCAAKTPAKVAPAAQAVVGNAHDVLVSKHDPASGKPDTSAIQIEPGIVIHLYEVVNSTQGRFHVVAGADVRDITLVQGTPMTLTFGTRTLSLTLKSVNAAGANLRVEAKGAAQAAHTRLSLDRALQRGLAAVSGQPHATGSPARQGR